jgi:hypothetical protein
MSARKIPSTLTAAWFGRIGASNKRNGSVHLKDKVFDPVFAAIQPEYDALCQKLATQLSTVWAANKDKFVDPEKPPRRQRVVQEYEDASDEEEYEPSEEELNLIEKLQQLHAEKAQSKAKAAAQPKKGRLSKIPEDH